MRFICIMLATMPAFRIVPAVALTLCLAVAPAQAQFWGNNGWGNNWGGGGSPYRQAPRPSAPSTPKLPPQASAPPQPALQEQPTPYDRDLQRLSEILGATAFPARHLQQQRRPEMAERGASFNRCRSTERNASRADDCEVSIAAIGFFSKPIAAARQQPTSSSAVIWRKAPRSPAISPRATPISARHLH